MTDTTRRLVAALERLPDDEQDEAAASFLQRLQRQEEPRRSEEEALYEPFRVMLGAKLDLPSDYSETYEEHLYGSAETD